MCRARIPHMTVEKFNTIALKIVQNLTCWIYIIRITRLVYSTFFLFLLLLISVESFLHNTFLQLYSSICFLLSEWTTIFFIICFTVVLRWVFVKCVLNNYCFFCFSTKFRKVLLPHWPVICQWYLLYFTQHSSTLFDRPFFPLNTDTNHHTILLLLVPLCSCSIVFLLLIFAFTW